MDLFVGPRIRVIQGLGKIVINMDAVFHGQTTRWEWRGLFMQCLHEIQVQITSLS